MLYQRDLKAKWNEYANLTTAKNEGVRKGAEDKSFDVVKNLLLKMNLSDEQAAEIAEVPVDFVKKVRKILN